MRQPTGLILLALVGLSLSACVGVVTPAPDLGSQESPYPATATVAVRDVTWRVVSSASRTTLPASTGPVTSQEGRFVVVVVEWTYHGTLTSHTENASLYDGQGREYGLVFTPRFTLDPPPITVGYQLMRAKPQTVSLVFDVPPDAKGLRLTTYDVTPQGDQRFALLPPG